MWIFLDLQKVKKEKNIQTAILLTSLPFMLLWYFNIFNIIFHVKEKSNQPYLHWKCMSHQSLYPKKICKSRIKCNSASRSTYLPVFLFFKHEYIELVLCWEFGNPTSPTTTITTVHTTKLSFYQQHEKVYLKIWLCSN